MENLEEFQIPEEAIEKLKDPEILRRYVDEGRSFQDIIGYNDDTMEKFYGAAYRLFQGRKFTEAADAFIFLTTLNPYVHNYWLGLGMSEQMTEEYEGALVAYGMAIMTNLDNPVPHYHSASCYALLGDYESALNSINLAIERASHRSDLEAFTREAEESKAKIQSRLNRE